MKQAASGTAGWHALLDRKYRMTCAVLAGNAALLAVNELTVANLLPTVVSDIGGERLYVWAITLFLGGSVVSASVTFWVLQRIGMRRSFLLGLAGLAVGGMVCGLAPSMEFFVAGRAVQGAACGLLGGLGYAEIRAALPRFLWTRVSALLSVMAGLQVFIAPLISEVFDGDRAGVHFGNWRWAFGVTVTSAAALAMLVSVTLNDESADRACGRTPPRVPLRSLLLIGASMLAVSVAQLPRDKTAAAVMLVVTAVLVGGFVAVDRRASEPVLPPGTYGSGPLKWVYLTLALLTGALMFDAYVPLFGQRLADLTPFKAGLLAAALTVGWMVSQVISAALENQRTIARVVVAGPLVMVGGLGLIAGTLRDGPPTGIIAIWALGLLFVGAGCGAAYPHLVVRALGAADGAAESSKAGIAINVVTQLSAALTVGVAGVMDIHSGETVFCGCLKSANWLIVVFAVAALGAAITSYLSNRLPSRTSSNP